MWKALAVIVVSCGSNEPADPTDDEPIDTGTTEPCDDVDVLAGTGLSAWEPLQATLPMQHGDQAGYHVWTAVRLGRHDTDVVVDATLRLLDNGDPGPVISTQRVFRHTGVGCPVDVAGVMNHLDFSFVDPTADPNMGWASLCGREVQVEIEVRAPGGQLYGWDIATTRVGPDPSEADRCPAPDTGP